MSIRIGANALFLGLVTSFWPFQMPAAVPEKEEKRAAMPWIEVAAGKKSFVLKDSGRPFVPWGFNYDHDERGRLLEDYWEAEWPKVEADFGEMKQLGANVVRVHLQFGRFMKTASQPDAASLDRLARLLVLAERTGLYLDLTGLACYHKEHNPAWYDELDEAGRWAAQARFWEAVAARCEASPAVFCYDLMNEPVVPVGDREPKDWLGPPLATSYFVQYITLHQGGRPRPAVARQWVETLTAAIRKHDRRHLVTVGLVNWSLDRPGLQSGFVPREIAGPLDFICIHLYPEVGKVPEALDELRAFDIGKPIVIEETFPLRCGTAEFEQFMEQSRKTAAGWIGFYWGKTPDEYRHSVRHRSSRTLGWLEYFEKRTKVFTRQEP